MKTIEIYKKKGYVVIDDFLPLEVANRLNELYTTEESWEKQDQVRERHYTHVFKTTSPCLPNDEEKYYAKFDRSKALENNSEFNSIYDNIIKTKISETLGVNLTVYDNRCYRLRAGDFYRTHIDDYAGDVGLIYYVNKRWVWDWGGILHVCNDGPDCDKDVASILPKFNRAVLISHKDFRYPHFISSVEQYALEPRYTIISFNK